MCILALLATGPVFANGNLIAEVKGAIREVEVGPGKTVEWFIVPVQTTKQPVEITSHYEAGMHAKVEIK